MDGPRTATVSLDDLDVQQLSQVKKQVDGELEHLSISFTQLHAAQSKFKDCLIIVNDSTSKHEARSILVPLTNSLYCRGQLPDMDKVLVDIGTGYCVEKTMESAGQFYQRKTEDLGVKLRDLEAVMQQKSANAQAVENTLRQKLHSRA